MSCLTKSLRALIVIMIYALVRDYNIELGAILRVEERIKHKTGKQKLNIPKDRPKFQILHRR